MQTAPRPLATVFHGGAGGSREERESQLSVSVKWAFAWMNFLLSRLPSRVRDHLLEKQQLITDLVVHGGREGLVEHARTLGIRGKWIRREPDLGGDGATLAVALYEAWMRMKEEQRSVSPAYRPATAWKSILDAEWSVLHERMEVGDTLPFEAFLRNFFRDGGISGLWGGREMFTNFATESGLKEVGRLALFVRQFEAWHREVRVSTLDDLDEPRVGNPWGYNVEGRLVIEPAFEYHTLALQVRKLVADVEYPVILEIGGGFGGLARQLLRMIPGLRYIGLDLPENCIIQSWYLTRSLPDRRVRVDELGGGNQQNMAEVDALLLPNWELARLKLSRLDVLLNVHSFGEMSHETLEAYFADIIRLQPEWIFHDNLSSPRRDGLYGIPSSEYPPLKGYKLVASCESRWPRYDHRSAYPCRETLFRRSGGARLPEITSPPSRI